MSTKSIVGSNKVDISDLIEINKTKKKITWAERKALIEKKFPSVRPGAINWVQLLSDPKTMGFVLQDVLKIVTAEPGRDGPRPSVNESEGSPILRQLWDEDYSYLPFHEALTALGDARRLSVRGIAAKTGIHYSQIYKYLKGERVPAVEEMILIAQAFRKSPAYFYEFRIAVLEAAMDRDMRATPELSVFAYKRLTGA